MQIYVPLFSGEPELPRPPSMGWIGGFLTFAGLVLFLLWFASAPVIKEGNENDHAGRNVLHDP